MMFYVRLFTIHHINEKDFIELILKYFHFISLKPIFIVDKLPVYGNRGR